jgi:hypothetical protein
MTQTFISIVATLLILAFMSGQRQNPTTTNPTWRNLGEVLRCMAVFFIVAIPLLWLLHFLLQWLQTTP